MVLSSQRFYKHKITRMSPTLACHIYIYSRYRWYLLLPKLSATSTSIHLIQTGYTYNVMSSTSNGRLWSWAPKTHRHCVSSHSSLLRNVFPVGCRSHLMSFANILSPILQIDAKTPEASVCWRVLWLATCNRRNTAGSRASFVSSEINK